MSRAVPAPWKRHRDTDFNNLHDLTLLMTLIFTLSAGSSRWPTRKTSKGNGGTGARANGLRLSSGSSNSGDGQTATRTSSMLDADEHGDVEAGQTCTLQLRA